MASWTGPSGTTVDPDALLALAVEVAREAGALAQSMRHEGVDVAQTKSSPVDVVTRADRASEELVRARVLAARPDDAVLGEEGDDVTGTSGVRWVVDPIDGTVNYLYGLPEWAVSLAAEVDGVVVAGVVHAPAAGAEYTAVLGGGSFRDGRPLSVRPVPPLAETLVATGFSYDAALRGHQAAAVARMIGRVRDVRRRGSCALDLCSVAEGTLDAYAEEGTHLWDHAAAGLVAREAGARFETWTTVRDRELVVCAAEGGFEAVAALVRESGFLDPVTGSGSA